jgi:hypothetical protein
MVKGKSARYHGVSRALYLDAGSYRKVESSRIILSSDNMLSLYNHLGSSMVQLHVFLTCLLYITHDLVFGLLHDDSALFESENSRQETSISALIALYMIQHSYSAYFDASSSYSNQ